MPDGVRRGLFHADEFVASDLAIQISALDQQSRLPGIPRLRAWALAALALTPGDRVLDIGSGTGDHAGELAEVAGEVIGVDPNPGMRAEAARRAPRRRFVDGNAYDLPFRGRLVRRGHVRAGVPASRPAGAGGGGDRARAAAGWPCRGDRHRLGDRDHPSG